MDFNKKMSLEESEWLWALKRSLLNEYYQIKYDNNNQLTPDLGGQIIGSLFRDYPKLLIFAYRLLSLDWHIMLWSTFPETLKVGKITTRKELNLNEFTWLMFKSLAAQLTVDELDELIDGDWRKYWKLLDAGAGINNKNSNKKVNDDSEKPLKEIFDTLTGDQKKMVFNRRNKNSNKKEDIHKEDVIKPTVSLNVSNHDDGFDALQYMINTQHIPDISAKYQIIYTPEIKYNRTRVEKYLLSTGKLVETTYEPLSDEFKWGYTNEEKITNK